MPPILSEILKFFGTAAVAYLIGCFNTAYFLGKRKKVNIFESGSGNPGASNAMTTMGWGAGVLVGAADIFKCALSVLLARLIFNEAPAVWIFAALFCIVGHMFPFYLKFKGGKGLACLVGALIALDWRAFVIGGILIIAVTLITDYIFISTCLVALLYPLLAYFLGRGDGFPFLEVGFAAATSVLIISKHAVNFKRLAAGTEIGLRGAHSGKYREKK